MASEYDNRDISEISNMNYSDVGKQTTRLIIVSLLMQGYSKNKFETTVSFIIYNSATSRITRIRCCDVAE